MDLTSICAAFGLSAAAGLNAWPPLFAGALLTRLDAVDLAQPFDELTGTGTLVLLVLPRVADFVGDKIPAVDHALHTIGQVVAPVSGAALFTGQTGVEDDVPTLVAVLLGAGTAESIHAGRAAIRPLSTIGTGGIGNPRSRCSRTPAPPCSRSPRSCCRCWRCCSSWRSPWPSFWPGVERAGGGSGAWFGSFGVASPLMDARMPPARWVWPAGVAAGGLAWYAADSLRHRREGGRGYELRGEVDAGDERFLRAAEVLTGAPVSHGNDVDLLVNGDQIFPAYLDAIRAAEETVNLLTYAYWRGEIADQVAQTLRERARLGVECNVIIDAVGRPRWTGPS